MAWKPEKKDQKTSFTSVYPDNYVEYLFKAEKNFSVLANKLEIELIYGSLLQIYKPALNSTWNVTENGGYFSNIEAEKTRLEMEKILEILPIIEQIYFDLLEWNKAKNNGL